MSFSNYSFGKRFIAVSTLSLIFACSKDGGHDSATTEDVKNQYVKMASAVYNDSLISAQNLQTSVDTLLANPNAANLLNAKAAYKAARISYQQSEIMRWDSDITLDQHLADDGGPASVDEWEGQVNAWPLDESHIDNIIAGSDVIDEQLLLDQNGVDSTGNEAEANVTTGVHAIEFLLWGEDSHGTGIGAGERAASDYDIAFCTNNHCDRRRTYLKVAVDLLVSDLQMMSAEWTPTAVNQQGTLAYNFINSNKALDYILLAMAEMSVGELAGARMNSGLETGDTEEEHDCFSDLSHVAIYNNFQGIKNAFYGRYVSATGTVISGASIAELIQQKDQATFTALDASFSSIETKMKALFDAGEREANPIKFDQIIGQLASDNERQIANAAVLELTDLKNQYETVQEILALNINITGDGD